MRKIQAVKRLLAVQSNNAWFDQLSDKGKKEVTDIANQYVNYINLIFSFYSGLLNKANLDSQDALDNIADEGLPNFDFYDTLNTVKELNDDFKKNVDLLEKAFGEWRTFFESRDIEMPYNIFEFAEDNNKKETLNLINAINKASGSYHG